MPSTDEILAFLDEPLDGMALGAALELGLFWLLESEPLETGDVGRALGIPGTRCAAWLDFLESIGFVERSGRQWSPSKLARDCIIDVYSRPTWRLLAQEARERLELVASLPRALQAVPGAAHASPGYVELMAADLDRARRFTRMLAEIHQGLADELATFLDLSGVRRLMDLGGGSGVVAMALARRWPNLSVTVVDIANVCVAGQEIVAEANLGDRIDFHAADFSRDPLPGGFDAVLECDVGVYSESIFRRVWDALRPGGRLVVVDEFGSERGSDRAHLRWRLVKALADPSWRPVTAAGTRASITRAGFTDPIESKLSGQPGVGGRMAGPYVLEARRPAG